MEEFRLKTPEAVDVSYDLAGIGSRFLAAAVDFVIWLAGFVVIVLGALAVRLITGSSTVSLILGLTTGFILFWGYYIIFETLWAGQTPGKRLVRIRVIKTTGHPIGFTESAIRNLVRIVDFLPTFYGVGVVVMFISPRPRRLGDFAAGTIVVKERRRYTLDELAGLPAPPAVSPPVLRGAVDPDELEWNVRALTPADLTVVNEYLDRAPRLSERARRELGDDIAGRIAARIGAREPLDAVRFLRRVVDLWEEER